jgi:hypothetical protein
VKPTFSGRALPLRASGIARNRPRPARGTPVCPEIANLGQTTTAAREPLPPRPIR